MFIIATPTADVNDLTTINQSANPDSHLTVLTFFARALVALLKVNPAKIAPPPNTTQTERLSKTTTNKNKVAEHKKNSTSTANLNLIVSGQIVCGCTL